MNWRADMLEKPRADNVRPGHTRQHRAEALDMLKNTEAGKKLDVNAAMVDDVSI